MASKWDSEEVKSFCRTHTADEIAYKYDITRATVYVVVGRNKIPYVRRKNRTGKRVSAPVKLSPYLPPSMKARSVDDGWHLLAIAVLLQAKIDGVKKFAYRQAWEMLAMRGSGQ